MGTHSKRSRDPDGLRKEVLGRVLRRIQKEYPVTYATLYKEEMAKAVALRGRREWVRRESEREANL